MVEITLEQDLQIANFNLVINKADIDDLRYLCKGLFEQYHQQKNSYLALMEHNWFKPEGIESLGFKERLQRIKIAVDNVASAILDGNLPDGWGRDEAQEFLDFSDALDMVLLNLEKLH